jgi:membrane glycosyltransferase
VVHAGAAGFGAVDSGFDAVQQHRPGPSSRAQLGLFLTPEETDPPSVLRYLDENLREDDPVLPVLRDRPSSRFVQALTDPYVNALHLSLLPEREPPASVVGITWKV